MLSAHAQPACCQGGSGSVCNCLAGITICNAASWRVPLTVTLSAAVPSTLCLLRQQTAKNDQERRPGAHCASQLRSHNKMQQLPAFVGAKAELSAAPSCSRLDCAASPASTTVRTLYNTAAPCLFTICRNQNKHSHADDVEVIKKAFLRKAQSDAPVGRRF